MSEGLELPTKGARGIERLQSFAQRLQSISEEIGFKVSARGWCYILEGAPYRLINKDQFDTVERVVNDCRKRGILPIDFTAEEEGRKFSGVEQPTTQTPGEFLRDWLGYMLNVENSFTPDWWDGEEYYIQMLVEKIDLKTLFEPVCKRFHIPIATSKGWSSMLQRAEYAKRFKEAEDRGMKCVLLYCGDHDPDGLRISEFIRTNLEDLIDIEWEDGEEGYDPADLIIDRFGLNYDFILQHRLTWIDNLITGSGANLASPNHKNNRMGYVQEYLRNIGVRKCEANSLVTQPVVGRTLCEGAILHYLGRDAETRFGRRREAIRQQIQGLRDRSGLTQAVQEALRLIQDGDEDDDDDEDDEEDER